MKKSTLRQVLAILSVLSILFQGCDEGTDDLVDLPVPLEGTYTLTEMTISVEATSLVDTTVSFIESQNGTTSADIASGSMVLSGSTAYSNTDDEPISGTVELSRNFDASLSGFLPVNWGTGCEPFILISELASDGAWSADTSTGTFSIDLVVDALDIDGTYQLTGNTLEVTYSMLEPLDERTIEVVIFNGSPVSIEPVCLPVSTVTERVLVLTIDT